MNSTKKDSGESLDKELKELWQNDLDNNQQGRIFRAIDEIGETPAPAGLKERILRGKKERTSPAFSFQWRSAVLVPVCLMALFLLVSPESAEKEKVKVAGQQSDSFYGLFDEYDSEETFLSVEIFDDDLLFLEEVL